MYARLGSKLTPDDIDAESSYNKALDNLVTELYEAGLVKESDGALCAFLPGFTAKDGTALPLIVRKKTAATGTPQQTQPQCAGA